MVTLELSKAVFLYISFSVIGILILWIFFDGNNRLPSFNEDKFCVWQCNICTHTYVDSVHMDISKCPLCGSFNERKDVHKNMQTKSGINSSVNT